MSINTKPRPMPRMNGTSGSGHAPSPVRGQDYSSSENEEDPLTGNCSECEECARNQASLSRHGHPHKSPDNLDVSVQRAYSYGASGSEDEADDSRHQRRRHLRQRRDDWQRAPPGGPRSRSNSRGESEDERHTHPRGVAMGTLGTMGTVRTMDSSSTGGENVYSRINDTATLPLSHIPPPPPDLPGPAVPPRPAQALISRGPGQLQVAPGQLQVAPGGQLQPLSYHPLQGMPPGHRTTYHELEPQQDFEPQFLQTTPDGNLFLPPTSEYPSMQTGGPVQFPRTVPRTASLPRHSRMMATPTNSTNTLQSRTTATGEQIPMITHDQQGCANIHPSYSFDRQNVTFNPNATLLNNVAPQQYPSIHSDFRDYARFNSASYRVKKKLRGNCSWRCAALVLIPLTIVLLILLAYFIPMAVYDLDWALRPRHVTMPDLTPTQSPTGATIPQPDSVIVKQYAFGRRAENTVPAKQFWMTQFYLPDSQFVKFNFSVPNFAVLGVYLRRSTHPTHAQYDIVHILDGSTIAAESERSKRAIGSQAGSTAFIEYLETGVWFVFIYNDDTEPHKVAFSGTEHDAPLSACPSSCHGHGECVDSQCHCFPGYTAWDCSQSVCPILCHGNGIYVRGQCDCYAGWKGKECALSDDECVDPSCSGNGQCVGGECVCSPGYKGEDCAQVDCIPSHCSDHGVCDVTGECVCYPGYRGSDCALPDSNDTLCVRDCSGHGVFDMEARTCVCSEHWLGDNCDIEICRAECAHGVCEAQRCVCSPGWQGAQCDLLGCDKDCNHQGRCNNGTCVCQSGYNGKYCSLDGCPNNCNNHGSCQMFRDGWRCSCRDGWKGKACDVEMETECGNGMDDDRDGLYDCLDPDCCMDVECAESDYCITAPDPMEILLRKQPPSNTASFYDRMRFLVEDDSVQSFSTLDSFEPSHVSVIRGKVVATDGSPLIGVRVSVDTQPLYGFTLTREQGLFDILVNGGGSVILQFQRVPFDITQVTAIVPWNEMVTIEPVTLRVPSEEGGLEEACEEVVHDHYNMRPIIMSTWQHTQLGACPARSAVIPESQVLQESQRIPGTDIYLVYHSSEAPGYESTILIQLTPGVVPADLALVHLRVSVEGLISERTFEAHASLKYTYAWNRRNAYNQKVYGIVSARVDVGYTYEGCGEVFWHTQAATMSGYDITSSEIGGWNLHIHHTYNFQEGILHKGDGTNIYLNEQPRKIVTVLGTGKQRRLDCSNCNGDASASRLMAPVALASGRDGSLYIGDFNYVRKLAPSREDVQSILQLNMPEVPYQYYMTVSPLDGRLYISDYQTKQIIRVKTMGGTRDLSSNFEVIAGTGEQCYPGDEQECGDGGQALQAKLFYPKGIAINKDGVVYFADGANIRMINRAGVTSTVIGHQGQPSQWRPLPCDGKLDVNQVTLKWPTALSINPLDDTLHILDNNMVLKLTKDHQGILVVAGYPLHCPPITSRIGSLLEENQSAPKLATEVVLKSPKDITFSPNAELFIVQSDGLDTNLVRMVNTDGTISHYAGAEERCECEEGEECECVGKQEELATKAPLNDPTAITVTPDKVLHIADMGHLRIHSVMATLPKADQNDFYEILHPETQERFYFNRFGQHIATKHLVTNQFIYNFTYNVPSYYGKLVKVTDAAGGILQIRRDYATRATEMIPPGGQKCQFSMDHMGMLHSFTSADNSTTFYTYISNRLLDTKKTTSGLTFLYDYDENGRLREVVDPTGERLTLTTDVDATGALAQINTEHKDQVVIATNGNLLSLLHGQTSSHVSYLQDGSLIVEYPFNMAVTLETSPHPLLNTEHQLQLKRRVILPGNVVHRLEWRYFPRFQREDGDKEMVSLRRRMRVGGRGGASALARHVLHDDNVDPASAAYTEGYAGKSLTLNGVTLLIMEYDRGTNTETFMNTDREPILTVHYNRAGSILRAVPTVSPASSVNITYNSNGKIMDWSRGEMSIGYLYDDRTGNLLEKHFGSRTVYRFIYKTGSKPTDVILPSGKQYLIHYDPSGNLKSMVMPSLAKHKFQSLTTLGLYRHIYHTPGDNGAYIRDYNNDGKLRQVLYPSGHRRLTYYYTRTGRVKSLYFDWTDVEYGYYTDDHLLHSLNISDRMGVQFACSLVFKPNESLVKSHEVRFESSVLTLTNAKFAYQYDGYLRIASFQATIGALVFPSYNNTFNPNTGQLTKMKQFIFEYPQTNEENIRDSNMEMLRTRDSYSRMTDVQLKFNNHVKFELTVTYDNLNRLLSWRRRVGTSDVKFYEYSYDIDNNIIGMIENDQPTWRYEIDENSNIEKITQHSRVRILEINSNNEIVRDDGSSYIFDNDGYMIQRGHEVFEYNSRGQMTHAFEPGNYDLFYYYDGLGRLVVRRDVLSGDVTQYYYGDVYHKQRITHVYDHTSQELHTLYYDNHGKLFAMQRDQEYYYIALDPIGSPIVIFNSIGSVVKLIQYDPLGHVLSDSDPHFRFDLGFQCGVYDPVTELVFLKGRVYQPYTGRWTGPDYGEFLDNLKQVWDEPESTNHYAFKGVVNAQQLHSINLMTDIPSWLSELGYDMSSLIPTVSFMGDINPGSKPHSEHLMPVVSAFECAFNRDTDSITAISTVPKSKITVSQSGLTIKSFEPIKSLLGNDVMLSAKNSKVYVDFLENPDAELAALATTLLNNSEIVDAQFTVHGRDVHYFVKPTLEEAQNDARTLALKPEGDSIGGVNVTIHRHHETPEVMLYADYRLHGLHSVLNVRYGTSVEEERERVLGHAMERAIQTAWLIERELAQSNKQSMYAWSEPQKEALRSKGSIDNMRTRFFRDVTVYPELADDPKNIKFVPFR